MKPKIYTFEQTRLHIALVSDTHAHIDPRILALINACDIAIHAGDVMDEEVLEHMRPRLCTIAVAGNNDAYGLWSSRQKRHTKYLPQCALIHLPSGTIAVEHGHRFGNRQPSHTALRAAYAEARAIVYGHTHKQLTDKTQTPWVINPGAAGLVRNQGGPRCLLLTVEDGVWSLQPHCFAQPEPDSLAASV